MRAAFGSPIPVLQVLKFKSFINCVCLFSDKNSFLEKNKNKKKIEIYIPDYLENVLSNHNRKRHPIRIRQSKNLERIASLKRPIFSLANSNRYPTVEILGVFIARHTSASRGVNGRSLTGSVTVDKLANEPRLLAC